MKKYSSVFLHYWSFIVLVLAKLMEELDKIKYGNLECIKTKKILQTIDLQDFIFLRGGGGDSDPRHSEPQSTLTNWTTSTVLIA